MANIIVGVCFIVGITLSFLGGRASVDQERVTYEDVRHDTHVDVRQEQRQEAIQAQVTVIVNGAMSNRFVNVNILNLTNVMVSCSSNTNWHESFTNRERSGRREAEIRHTTNRLR